MSEQLAFEKLKPGFAYLQMALNSAFVVNGGALIALYPLAQWLTPVGQRWIVLSALIFVAGIFFAYRCATVSFKNFEFAYNEKLATTEDAKREAEGGLLKTRKLAFRLGEFAYRCFILGAAITALLFVLSHKSEVQKSEACSTSIITSVHN